MAGAAAGGAETACIDMCLAMRAAGLEVQLATRKNGRNARLTAGGITVHELPFGGFFDFTTARHLAKIIAAFQPDIVQTWMSRAAQKLPRRPRTAPYKVVARLGGYYKLRHFERADYFITITPLIRDYLVTQGVAPDRIRALYNFADTEAAGSALDRADFQTPPNAPLLLALGRLHRAKAFDVLLEAMAALPEAYLWIAGEGPERVNLEEQIRALGLQGRVRLLGWRDDRAALFAACDICIFPSRYEPFGTVFVQAWAQGRPLVAAASDGPRATVRDGEDGLLVPINDAPALSRAIRHVLDNPDLAARLAAAGRHRYEAEFTRERAVAAYLDFYRDVAGRAAIT